MQFCARTRHWYHFCHSLGRRLWLLQPLYIYVCVCVCVCVLVCLFVCLSVCPAFTAYILTIICRILIKLGENVETLGPIDSIQIS